MGWSIAELKNTVEISDECAQELFEKANSGIWYGVEDVKMGGDNLYFDPDHQEHMDFLWDGNAQAILKKHKVEGDICFGSLEGDNAGSFWGYRFDGQGNMTELKGNVSWDVVTPAPAAKPTASRPKPGL